MLILGYAATIRGSLMVDQILSPHPHTLVSPVNGDRMYFSPSLLLKLSV